MSSSYGCRKTYNYDNSSYRNLDYTQTFWEKGDNYFENSGINYKDNIFEENSITILKKNFLRYEDITPVYSHTKKKDVSNVFVNSDSIFNRSNFNFLMI